MKIVYRIENIIWITLISIIIYLIVPLIFRLIFKEYDNVISVLCVLFINVIYSFISSLVLTKKYGFNYIYPIIIGIVFIPCSYMLYNIWAIIYSILYIVIGLVGSLICFKYTSKK